MTKLSFNALPEVFISNAQLTKVVFRALKEGKIRKIASKLYTKNLKDSPEVIVKRNLWPIVGMYFPDALIADRTALENQPSEDGSIFLISPKKRPIVLPGVIIRPRKGSLPLSTDKPFVGGLYLSSQGRAFLENMKLSRSSGKGVRRTLSQKEIEERLDLILRRGGEEALNKIREEARSIVEIVDCKAEFKKLDSLIGGLLGSQSTPLTSHLGIQRQLGLSYDPERLLLFEILRKELETRAPAHLLDHTTTTQEKINLAFFESYFSNFIEGTEFEVQEAMDIVFKGKIPTIRPEDAHDILGTYILTSNDEEMSLLPKNFDSFLELLKHRHFTLMQFRKNVHPGEFKTISNKAGSTVFVDPKLVKGTLQKGFELYQSLDAPLQRAIFMMFLITEVHPFVDGNGRIARIMMNAELISKKEQRIVIPTVYRNNYLSALKVLSQNAIAEPLILMLEFAQKYTSKIDFKDFSKAHHTLDTTHAFMDSHIAEANGIRLTIPT